ncbi:MAG TPA: phosphatase PAP2 family protein, partial [Parvularculaceae bacterium]|nr:phosphatase PAP2 family protein [Parvularculaceae bacterium]
TFPRMRPDGSDDRSFPSGHTSVSFAAAATLTNRYGWKVGLPAHALAAFVGASRVKARKHHVSDVLVGAAIGELSGFLITSKLNDNVAIIPWADAEGGGVLVTGRF